MNIVILAGGIGSRLWPMSRVKKPKQFYNIISKKPLIMETYNRFLNDYGANKIFILTSSLFVPEIKRIWPEFPEANLLIEPEKRDTAAAMGFAQVKLSLIAPDEPVAFIPADHYIGNLKKFIKCFQVAEQLIKETGKMLDIGINPTFPSTSLGYMKIGGKYREIDDVEIYEFTGHKEKPDFTTAKKYLETGDYLWHTGYYMWTPRLFLKAWEKYNPSIYGKLDAIKKACLDEKENEVNRIFSEIEPISLDYALTEKIAHEEALVIKGDFAWSDIGTWEVVQEQLAGQRDENSNLIQGKAVLLNSSGNLIYGQTDKIIATCGLDNFVIVDTPDALLICPKSRSGEVKEIVANLKKEGEINYL